MLDRRSVSGDIALLLGERTSACIAIGIEPGYVGRVFGKTLDPNLLDRPVVQSIERRVPRMMRILVWIVAFCVVATDH